MQATGKTTSKKNLLGTKKSASKTTGTKSSTSPISDSDLMEKLLNEITAKYKTNLCKDQAYLQRLEKKTMIQEIQMLAQALISCDRAQKKQSDNHEKAVRRMQNDLVASEDQVKTSLKRLLKLEKEYEKLQVQSQDLALQLEGSQ